jgi:CheY-like chemotaxis protein
MTNAACGLSQQAVAAPGCTLQVLVVDDVPANRELLCALVGHYGHCACEADNGLAALERVAAGGVDLVLLDIEMPHCDGLQATRRIRELPLAARYTPVWIVTAHAFDYDIERARAAGADGFLSKPIDFQALSNVLQALIRSSGSRRTSFPLCDAHLA